MRFECNRCAICCGDTKEKTRHILLLNSEVKEIAEKSLHSIADFCVEFKDKQPYAYEIRKNRERKCFFLKDNKCAIYVFRPLICRFYPFELKFAEDQNQHLFEFTLECPGINEGKVVGKSDFKKLFKLAQEKLEDK